MQVADHRFLHNVMWTHTVWGIGCPDGQWLHLRLNDVAA